MIRYRKTAVSVAGLLLLGTAILAWHRFWPGPRRVDGGIFKLRKVLTTRAGDIWRARFNNDRSLIVTASTDGTAKVWRRDGTIVRELKHPIGVTSADFSPDGTIVATSSYDGRLRIWDVATGRSPYLPASATHAVVPRVQSGRALDRGAGEDRVVHLWNARTGR